MDLATPIAGHQNGQAAGLTATLDRALAAIGPCVATGSPLPARMDRLRERWREKRLQLAVLGQFKRGKSSFINALLGAPLLPIGVVPLTAVPTFIAWRAQPLVVVRFKDERAPEQLTADGPDAIREFLFRFVAEEANPENRLGVARADLFYPAPVLADGTVLIDTPGVGSTLRHNTEAALGVLPECDAALFILSADPPITATELDYLRQLRSKTARILFVLNKADHLSEEERKTATEFLRKVLEQNGVWQSGAGIFSVSARNGLDAKRKRDRSRLAESGIGAVETHLIRDLAAEKGRMLESAITRKAHDILSEAAAEAALRIRALQMPLAELAEKSRAFEAALRAIEEQRRITRDLLAGDQRRLREELEARTDALRRDAVADLAKVIDGAIAARSGGWDETARAALAAAIEATFDGARRDFTSLFSGRTDLALGAQRGRIDALTEAVRRTAAEIFQVPFGHDAAPEPFHLGEDPYWVTEEIEATLIPQPSRLVDCLLPKAVRARRRRARVVGRMQQLVVRNTENLRWAVLRGMDETFRNAGASLDERLDDAIAATRGVIAEALARRSDRTAAVEPELARLNQAAARLSALREALATAGAGHST